MIVNRADTAGACFGVKRAFDIAMKTAKSDERVVMLGDIVHNEHVVRKIDEAGVKVMKDLDSVPAGSTLILRAHGAVPEIYEAAERRGLKIVDATCPMVFEIHDEVKALAQEGYSIVVIGDHGHDEVVGIAGQVPGAIVVSNPDEARLIPRKRKIGVVTQSTQNIDNVRQCVAELCLKSREVRFINTICAPTKNHQDEIRTMPYENDVMVIIGSRTSANTCRLTEISRSINPRTYQVASAAELKPEWFVGARTVGVSAGASTPDWIIDEVVAALERMNP
ncbi:MAG TPA: 4-hydroxy-3-methylbut-2-enyl diphosphate reductase [Thermodesulfobacteriota bacterium]